MRVFCLFSRYHAEMHYQAILQTPFAALGIRCTDDAVSAIDFLPSCTPPLAPARPFPQRVCESLQHYLHTPGHVCDLPLSLSGTPFQQKVWAALRMIPVGHTCTYGVLAGQLGSGSRAVANACGANPIPVIIPCHRVVGSNGLGGFMKGREQASLDIKRWLLEHERSASGVA